MKFYTKGYYNAAANAGATSRADVRRLQSQLNEKGASLTEDGIWGPKTDAAYSRYMGSAAPVTRDYEAELNRLLTERQKEGYENPYAAALEAAARPSGTDYAAQARAAVTPAYREERQQLLSELADQSARYDEDRAQARARHQAAGDELTEEYVKDRAQLEQSALRRGLGRSSYLTDSLAYLAGQKQADRTALAAQLSDQLSGIDAAQQLARRYVEETVSRLEEDMLDELITYEAALRERDQKSALTAYQALLDSYDAYERTRQQDLMKIMTTLYDAAIKKETAAAKAASSSSGRSGSSSSAKEQEAAGEKQLMTKRKRPAPTLSEELLYRLHPGSDPTVAMD